MKTKELIDYLNVLLSSSTIKDYCPNGLQVEGKESIQKVITGVTASQALIDAAIEHEADLVLVHHGYFWKGESEVITGLKKNRIKALLQHDINLAAYHLPVDVHPELGNNSQLGKLFGIEDIQPLQSIKPEGIVMFGRLSQPMMAHDFGQHIKRVLNRAPLINSVRTQTIETVAWCTGGGQSFIDQVAQSGIDVFVTGEVSEQTIHSSREYNIDFIAAGHHATERYGIKAVGEHLVDKFDLDVTFIDIDNPA